MSIVVKCSNCGRLHVFWNGFDEPQTIYRKDENTPTKYYAPALRSVP
jgi:hypothetical protein